MKYAELQFYQPEIIFSDSNSNSAASHSYHIIIIIIKICFAVSEDVFQLHKLQWILSSTPEHVQQQTWANGQDVLQELK